MYLGGIVIPILLGHLLTTIGFGWSLRILGFISLLMPCLAMLAIRNRLPQRKLGPILDLKSFKDAPYMIFLLGVAFLCLGE